MTKLEGKDSPKHCTNPTACSACKEIIRYFEVGPRTLTEVAGKMQKRVSTIHYHAAGLVQLGVLKKSDGKYSLSTAEHVDDLVLQIIAEGPKLLSEIISDKRVSVFPAEQVHQSVDRHLLRRHLVSWYRPIDGTTRFEKEYKLSYIAAEILQVCLHCGKPLDDGSVVVQLRVQEVISERHGAISLGREEIHHGALIHSSCFAKEQRQDYLEQEKVREDNLCGLCGLPIDSSSLEDEFATHDTVGVKSLIPHLTSDELIGLVTFATKDKAPEKPSRNDVENAVYQIVGEEKLLIRGLADCERLLFLVDEGLRSLPKRNTARVDIANRARELWEVAAARMRSERDYARSLIRQMCGPQGALLGRTSLYLQTYPFLEKGEFTEEEIYFVGGRKEFGIVKGSVEDSSCGIAVKRDGKLYHPACELLWTRVQPNAKSDSPKSGIDSAIISHKV